MPHLRSAAFMRPSQPVERDDEDQEAGECVTEDSLGRGESMQVRKMFASAAVGSKYIRRGRSMDCIHFAEEDIRRGVPVTNVLACFGSILGTSQGSAATYDMSRPIERLGVFISHNWSTRRLPKFLTLAYHFNFVPASALCVVIDLVGGALIGLHFVDVRISLVNDIFVVEDMACLCTIATCIAFPIVLLFGHDLWRFSPGKCRRPVVFLDKICIHQTDKDRQRKGIENLSAFLEASDRMVIVYTSTYLERLWTVYELATMLILRENPAITVIPTEVVMILCNAWVMMITFLSMHFLVVTIHWDFALLLGKVLIGVVTMPFIVQLRLWAKKRAMIWSQAKAFTIRGSNCAVESDRKTVYGNVCILMRVCGYVHMSADDDAALDAFDQLARDLVPLHLQNSWGRSGLPWRCGFSLSPVWLAVMADVLCSSELWNATPSRIICHTGIWLALALAASPLWAAFAAWVSGWCIHLEGVREKIFLCLAWVLVCAAAVAMYWGSTLLWVCTWRQPELVWVVAPCCCVAIAVTVQVYCLQPGTELQQDRVKTDYKAKSLNL